MHLYEEAELSYRGLSWGMDTASGPHVLCVQTVVQGRWCKFTSVGFLIVPTHPEPIANSRRTSLRIHASSACPRAIKQRTYSFALIVRLRTSVRHQTEDISFALNLLFAHALVPSNGGQFLCFDCSLAHVLAPSNRGHIPLL